MVEIVSNILMESLSIPMGLHTSLSSGTRYLVKIKI